MKPSRQAFPGLTFWQRHDAHQKAVDALMEELRSAYPMKGITELGILRLKDRIACECEEMMAEYPQYVGKFRRPHIRLAVARSRARVKWSVAAELADIFLVDLRPITGERIGNYIPANYVRIFSLRTECHCQVHRRHVLLLEAL